MWVGFPGSKELQKWKFCIESTTVQKMKQSTTTSTTSATATATEKTSLLLNTTTLILQSIITKARRKMIENFYQLTRPENKAAFYTKFEQGLFLFMVSFLPYVEQSTTIRQYIEQCKE